MSEPRVPTWPIDPLFLRRWSPRAMSGEPLSELELMTLFEAARWAPSASNAQPWRFLYARRDTPHWERFFSFLNERNAAWCGRAAALVVVLSKKTTDAGEENWTAAFDTGAAWMSLALQGTIAGLVVHAMAGFDYDRAQAELDVPADWDVQCMVAIGRPGDPALLPERQRAREFPSQRRPLVETVFEGGFPRA
jgi:nitroreductase